MEFVSNWYKNQNGKMKRRTKRPKWATTINESSCYCVLPRTHKCSLIKRKDIEILAKNG